MVSTDKIKIICETRPHATVGLAHTHPNNNKKRDHHSPEFHRLTMLAHSSPLLASQLASLTLCHASKALVVTKSYRVLLNMKIEVSSITNPLEV